MSRIYLDHAAATPLHPLIEKDLSSILPKISGNPSSPHKEGQGAYLVINKARFAIAENLGDKPSEIVFVSGATEALHLALVGSWLNGQRGIIGVSPLSHSAVLNAASFLQKHFGAKVERLPLTEKGILDLDFFDQEALEQFSHIVIEHVNSEVGLVQPIKKIGRILEKKKGRKEKVPCLIVDAAGSAPSLAYGLRRLKADMLVFSGEKIGALPGIGVLIKKESIGLSRFIGGSQEFGLRGGTENSLGIWSLGEAVRIKEKERAAFAVRCKGFQALLRAASFWTPTVEENLAVPHVFHGVLKGDFSAISVLQKLDMKGVAIASGPACSSGSSSGSLVLETLGLGLEDTKKGLRVSFGNDTTEEEIKTLISLLK